MPLAVNVLPNLPAARVPYGDARLGVLVARRAWPQNPCNGHEQVQAAWDAPAWTQDLQGPMRAAGMTLLGAANLAGQRCLIWITPRQDRTTTCKLVVHEMGHWDGQEHTDRGPMATDMMNNDYAPCAVPR